MSWSARQHSHHSTGTFKTKLNQWIVLHILIDRRIYVEYWQCTAGKRESERETERHWERRRVACTHRHTDTAGEKWEREMRNLFFFFSSSNSSMLRILTYDSMRLSFVVCIYGGSSSRSCSCSHSSHSNSIKNYTHTRTTYYVFFFSSLLLLQMKLEWKPTQTFASCRRL